MGFNVISLKVIHRVSEENLGGDTLDNCMVADSGKFYSWYLLMY